MTTVPPITLPSYFGDPSVDTQASVVMGLAAEVWVSRDRIRVLERLVVLRGQLSVADIDNYQPTEEEKDLLRKERDEFFARLFKHTGQVSSGSPS